MKSSIGKSPLAGDSALLQNYRATLRRNFVDDFFFRSIRKIKQTDLVLDLGGNKNAKRGVFHVEQFHRQIVYANYTVSKDPDVQADAHALPFAAESFDCIICSELFEHLKNPFIVCEEISRVLRPHGRLLITVPFLFPIHADPSDFFRYTDQFWATHLNAAGFTNVSIEWQGGFWCVMFDMLRGLTFEKEAQWTGVKEKMMNWLNVHLQWALKKKAIQWDASGGKKRTFFMKGCTTGFGITCYKK